jgi:hypothetical protein
MPLMRRTAPPLALVLACALLSACGKGAYTGAASSSSSSAGGSSAHSATHGDKAGRGSPPSRARALAFARAVNLTAADVPGFTPSHKPNGESPAERRLQQQLRSCGGAAGAGALKRSQGALVEASSPDFELHRSVLALSVSSEVAVAHTSAQAAATLAAIRNPRLRACFSRYLSSLLKSQHYPGAQVLGVSIAAGTPPAPGTAGGFAWRVTATLAIRTIHISFYFDILGFIDGPAQVTLTSSGTVRPFPARAQEQLYSQLLARARAQKL